MVILGIETSCDDTAVSVVKKKYSNLTELSHVRFSQIKTHAKYGGVVPEVAAREHTVTIIPTLEAARSRAKIAFQDIDLIAVTQGPGLAPALSVGIDTARILSATYQIPITGIQHIEGHMLSVWPVKKVAHAATKPPALPILSLVVSGGHTQLVLIKKIGSYTILGKTRDDAAGEAFDKVASLLGLPYPGGPQISAYAEHGKRDAFDFPRPMLREPNLDFSFSGLKTAVRYLIDSKKKLTKNMKQDIAASFEEAVVDVLIRKTERAIEHVAPKSLSLVGGVSANTYLRASLTKTARAHRLPVYLSPPALSQDNATMIAMVAALKKERGSTRAWKTLDPKPSWEVA